MAIFESKILTAKREAFIQSVIELGGISDEDGQRGIRIEKDQLDPQELPDDHWYNWEINGRQYSEAGDIDYDNSENEDD